MEIKKILNEDFEYETDSWDDGEVEQGKSFFEDGYDWKWIKRVGDVEHLDFDNWAVWMAFRPEDENNIHGRNATAFFIVDEDTGFIDWGPCDTYEEAKEFLDSKVQDWEDDAELDEAWEPTFSDEWKPEDIELWKSIDWKARDYRPYVVEDDTFEGEVIAYGLPGGEQKATVTFAKELSPNSIYEPVYRPTSNPFKGTVGFMYNGNKHDGYLVMDRTETQEVYDMLSEKCNSIKESDEEQPYTKEEVEKDLKSITHNFTDKEGELKCGFEEEKNFGVEILKKHYKVVEPSGDDRRSGTWYHISYAEPKNLKNESKDLTICPNCGGDQFNDQTGLCIDCGYDEKAYGELDESKLNKSKSMNEDASSPLDSYYGKNARLIYRGVDAHWSDKNLPGRLDHTWWSFSIEKAYHYGGKKNVYFDIVRYDPSKWLNVGRCNKNIFKYDGNKLSYTKDFINKMSSLGVPEDVVNKGVQQLTPDILGYDAQISNFIDTKQFLNWAKSNGYTAITQSEKSGESGSNALTILPLDYFRYSVNPRFNTRYIIKDGKISGRGLFSLIANSKFNYKDGDSFNTKESTIQTLLRYGLISKSDANFLSTLEWEPLNGNKSNSTNEIDRSSEKRVLTPTKKDAIKVIGKYEDARIDHSQKAIYCETEGTFNALINELNVDASDAVKLADDDFVIYLNESKSMNEGLFNDYIYLFPELTDDDIKMMAGYNIKYLGMNHGPDGSEDNWVVYGRKEDIEKYAEKYLGYELHPDYLYEYDDFAGEIVD